MPELVSVKQRRFDRILVTGGAGFIGSHLVDALIDNGYKVTILDNLSFGTRKNITLPLDKGQAHLVKGDVRRMREVREALHDIDFIFHLAAITSVPFSFKNSKLTDEVNAQGTRNLLEASLDSNVERFMNISSCAVYGNPEYLPIDEVHPLKPMSPYAESKVRGEDYCAEFKEKHGLETLTYRLFNVYGSRQPPNEYSGVITRFIEHVRKNKPPLIYGDGAQTRDFVHVSDVVRALLLSMSSINVAGETFNIGSGKATSINELCQTIIKKLNARMKPLYTEPRQGDIKHSWAKIEKARKLLGYEPRVLLEQGLEDLIGSSVRKRE